MQTLDKRITALEQASPTDIGPIFIHLVGLDTKDNPPASQYLSPR